MIEKSFKLGLCQPISICCKRLNIFTPCFLWTLLQKGSSLFYKVFLGLITDSFLQDEMSAFHSEGRHGVLSLPAVSCVLVSFRKGDLSLRSPLLKLRMNPAGNAVIRNRGTGPDAPQPLLVSSLTPSVKKRASLGYSQKQCLCSVSTMWSSWSKQHPDWSRLVLRDAHDWLVLQRALKWY